MKKLIVIVLGLLCLSCEREGHRNCEGAQWDYPVKPGTEEWGKLSSHAEMVAICQIPEKFLYCLSTNDLASLCLRYPLSIDIFAFNSLGDGLDGLYNNFNGLRELYERDDVSDCLIKRYVENIDTFTLLGEDVSELDKTAFAIQSIWLTEAIVSRVEHNLKETLSALVYGYEKECEHPEFFNNFSTNFFARAHIIIKINPQNLEKISLGMNNPVFGGLGYTQETADMINELSYQLIK